MSPTFKFFSLALQLSFPFLPFPTQTSIMSEVLPERTKEETSAPEAPQAASTAPSKNALKKAAKEKEKAEKAAKRAAEEQKAAAVAAANDVSKHLYGKTDSNPKEEPAESLPETCLEEFTTGHDGKDVMIEANVDNARVQSAKLGFLVLRQELDTIQAVIAESPDLISRQMVKWASNINRESVVRVYGRVQQAPEPVNSATISNFELHIQRIYLVAEAAQKLPLQIKDVMSTPLGADEGTQSNGDPNVTLNTRLNHRVLDLRTPRSHAIGSISHTAEKLFREYMDSHGAKEVITPKIMGAAAEGGSNVFEMNYFGGKAYLAQSPQLHKQMLISSGRRKVFEVGTVFRAENSNTHRHLTEVIHFLPVPFPLRSNELP
jgi:aspartyl-tRNA synthetase